jgi:hypothetical protein
MRLKLSFAHVCPGWLRDCLVVVVVVVVVVLVMVVNSGGQKECGQKCQDIYGAYGVRTVVCQGGQALGITRPRRIGNSGMVRTVWVRYGSSGDMSRYYG